MHFNEMEQHGHDVYEFAYGYDESSPQHWQTTPSMWMRKACGSWGLT